MAINETGVTVKLIIKGAENSDAVKAKLSKLATFINEWFTEEPHTTPQPEGALLWWGTEGGKCNG